MMKREKVAVYVGGKIGNVKGIWSAPGGVLDNAYFDVLAFVSDVDTAIGIEIWNNMKVEPMDVLSGISVDEVIIMAAEYEPFIESVRTKLYDMYGIPKENMPASMFIQKVPYVGNLGGVEFDASVPKGRYVNMKYLLKENLISGKNDLEKFFFQGNHRLIDKWTHYFEVYEREFSV